MAKAESYELRTETGAWLGQVIITDDGMFSGVTDYGNFSYSWRSFGKSFKDFILRINVGYFGDKMATGLSYIIRPAKSIDAKCYRFAEHILPALQKAIRNEVIAEKETQKIIQSDFDQAALEDLIEKTSELLRHARAKNQIQALTLTNALAYLNKSLDIVIGSN